MKQGMFITLEGNDGAGKTTAALSLKKEMEKLGYDVLYTREPGGCSISEQIRNILLDPANTEMDPKTEAILYAASRNQHVKQTILPALRENKIVLCDRFLDSSLAYQGEGRNLGMKEVEALNDFGLEGFRPDLTLFYAVSIQTGEKRMNQRGIKDRMDAQNDDFHQSVRNGFLKRIAQCPDRIHVIDAEQSPARVLEDSLKIIQSYIEEIDAHE